MPPTGTGSTPSALYLIRSGVLTSWPVGDFLALPFSAPTAAASPVRLAAGESGRGGLLLGLGELEDVEQAVGSVEKVIDERAIVLLVGGVFRDGSCTAADGRAVGGLSSQRRQPEYGTGKDSGYGDWPRDDLHAGLTLHFAEGCGPQQRSWRLPPRSP